MKRSFILLAAIGAAAVTGLSSQNALASNITFSSSTRTINACVLVSSASEADNNNVIYPVDPAPYLFYAVSNFKGYTPAGWNIQNPLAPPVINAAIYQSWKQRTNGTNDPAFNAGTPQYAQFQIGQPVDKSMGAYWEENLDTMSQADLDRYNIVYMPLSGQRYVGTTAVGLLFSESEKEKLRQYVDQGGTLILESVYNYTPKNYGSDINFFIPLVTQHIPGFGPNFSDPNPSANILNWPLKVSYQDILGLYGFYFATSTQFVSTGMSELSPAFFKPIVTAPPEVVIAQGNYGAGQIIYSFALLQYVSGQLAPASNYMGVQGFRNTGAVSGAEFTGDQSGDLKLAVNVVGAAGGVSHEAGATPQRLPTTVASAWSAVPSTSNNIGGGSSIVDGLGFTIDGNNLLHCYDLTPGTSLGGFGSANGVDNGLQDYSVGTPYDEIWNLALPGSGRYGAPRTISNGQGIFVAATSSTGNTVVAKGITYNPNGVPNASSSVVFSVAGSGGPDTALDPTTGGALPTLGTGYAGGFLFAPVYSGNGWQIEAVDFANSVANGATVPAFGSGESSVVPPSSVTSTGLGPICGPVTAGFVTDAATGAQDLVAYAPLQGVSAGATGGFAGAWFETRGEPLEANGTDPNNSFLIYQPKGDRAVIPWFDNSAGNASLLPVIYVSVVDSAGNLLSMQVYQANNSNINILWGQHKPVDFPTNEPITPGQNFMEIEINPAAMPALPAGQTYVVSADYALDWPGDPINGTNLVPSDLARITSRGFTLYNPSASPGANYLAGGLSMDPTGSLLFTSHPTGILDNSGGNATPLQDRVYSVTDQFSGTTLGGITPAGTTVNWMWSPTNAEVFDGSQIKQRLTYTASNGTVYPVSGFKVVGKPAVFNGTVYVVGTCFIEGAGQGNAAVPATVVLALASSINPVVTLNPAIELSTTAGAAQTPISVQQPDLERSTVGSPAYSTLTPNRDYVINKQIDNTGAVYATAIVLRSLQPVGNRDTFNAAMPLFISNGTTGQRTEIAGTSGFGPLDNLQWAVVYPEASVVGDNTALQSQETFSPPSSGLTASTSGLFYGTQAGTIVQVNLTTASAVKTPGAVDIATAQAAGTLTNASGAAVAQSIIYPPAAAQGNLLVSTPGGVADLNSRSTVIMDNSRLLSVDAGGNVEWMINSTSLSVEVRSPFDSFPSAQTSVPFSGATAVHEVAPGQYIAADTNNNRIVWFDSAGNVLQNISAVRNDLMVLPQGQSLSLSGPTDVQFYTETSASGNTTVSYTNPVTGVIYSYTGPLTLYHYIIADSGNYRAMEVVDGLNPITGAFIQLRPTSGTSAPVLLYHQVVFATASLATQNQHWRYRTIEQFFDPVSGVESLIAAISNVTPASYQGLAGLGTAAADVQGSDGGAVLFLARTGPWAGTGTQQAKIIQIATSINVPNGAGGYIQQPIQKPTFFKQFYLQVNGVSQLRYLLCDANGCYELQADPSGKALDVDWMLTSSDYAYLTGRPLDALSLQRIPSTDVYTDASGTHLAPHYLITNGYKGNDGAVEWFNTMYGAVPPNVADGYIHGEVFEIRSTPYYSGGYRQAVNVLYTQNGLGEMVQNPSSAIVQLIPNEQLIQTNTAGTVIKAPIRRALGTAGSGSDSTTLSGPTYSFRP